jgi:hypothetical protein
MLHTCCTNCHDTAALKNSHFAHVQTVWLFKRRYVALAPDELTEWREDPEGYSRWVTIISAPKCVYTFECVCNLLMTLITGQLCMCVNVSIALV